MFNKRVKNDVSRKSQNVDLTRQLIGYIYNTIDVSKFKYEMLEHKHDLDMLLQDDYYVSVNHIGKNCFLTFTQIGNKYYSFLVDRKQLSYTIDKICYDNIDIVECNVDIDMQAYNGSILDGIYVTNNGENQFIITDIYFFRNRDYTNICLDIKLFEFSHYLGSLNGQLKERPNNRIDVTLDVNKIFKMNEINKVVAEMNNKNVRGLCFYPALSGTKLIFLSNNIHEKNKQKEPIVQHVTKITKNIFTAKLKDKEIYAILEMKPTDTVDVYNLFAVEKIMTNNGTKLRKKKMDVAYISNIEKSQWCRKIIAESPEKSAFVKCKWRDDKNKWEPIEQNTTVKLPSLVSDLMKYLVEIEVSDSDDE